MVVPKRTTAGQVINPGSRIFLEPTRIVIMVVVSFIELVTVVLFFRSFGMREKR